MSALNKENVEHFVEAYWLVCKEFGLELQSDGWAPTIKELSPDITGFECGNDCGQYYLTGIE